MKISAISNSYCSYGKNLKNSKKSLNSGKSEIPAKNEKKQNTVSFKSIYLENNTDIGIGAEYATTLKFSKRDALLLNEIAQDYPNQDCFIRCGEILKRPYLEYREKPVDVPLFTLDMYDRYIVTINPHDKECTAVPLIIYPDSEYGVFIGLTAKFSLNPSLVYTIKAGFEVHKKLLDKKFQILESAGRSDPDLGEDSVIEKAHKEIEEVEVAVTRYLLENAYTAALNRDYSIRMYKLLSPKIRDVLDSKRKLDLVTSAANRPKFNLEELDKEKIDICEYATRNFPNLNENKARIAELTEYMLMVGGMAFGD